MVARRNTVPRGLVYDLPVRLNAIDRLALQAVTDRGTFAVLLKPEVAREFASRKSNIAVDTGALLRGITSPTGDRLGVDVVGGDVVVSIDHPGAYYQPDRVLPSGLPAAFRDAVRRALLAYARVATSRAAQGASTRLRGLLGRAR